MNAPLRIRIVESDTDLRTFYLFPWKVYANDPHWTPPLISMRRDIFDRRRNPAWEYLEGDYFLALRGDTVVGTIAAYINHRHNAFQQERIGWFGAFEVYNDPEAAALLLDTATEWVAQRGYATIRGPQTLTTHEEVGLLVDGFAPPVFLMPYHHPYYQGFIETAGFEKRVDLYSFYYDWEMGNQTGSIERIARLADYVARRARATVRPINTRDLRKDFEQFKEIYNDAWTNNFGFVPLTDRELDGLIASLKVIFDPRLAGFVEIDGELVAFIILIPDLNQALRLARPRPGVPEPFTLARLLWHWKVRPKITRFRVPLFGVREKYRHIGADLLLMDHVLQQLRHLNYTQLDGGWILENNHDMRRVMEQSLGMKPYRTYRLYEKPTGTDNS